MAQPTNTYATNDTEGIREDLSDVIALVAREECPLQEIMPTRNVSATKHEWQTRDLATASSSNAHIEGDDTSLEAANVPVRVGNYTQISKKSVVVSGTTQAVDHAGIQDVLDDQIEIKLIELKRDMESQMLSNTASDPGTDVAARVSAGLPAWLETNVSRGATGADGGYNSGTGVVDAATDGTQRAFPEPILKDVIQDAWTTGGNPNTIMLGPYNKRVFSGFSGIADLRRDANETSQAGIVAAADMFISDFGTQQVVVNRFQRERDMFVIDPNFLAQGSLRAPFYEELSKTGDNTKGQIIVEYTLIVDNEKAHGQGADLTTS